MFESSVCALNFTEMGYKLLTSNSVTLLVADKLQYCISYILDQILALLLFLIKARVN